MSGAGRSLQVEIVRDAPCDGRRQELLRLATALVATPRDAALRGHVASCPRCRAFLDHASLGLRLAERAFASAEARFGATADPDRSPPFDLTRSRSFENWLDRELWSRGRRDLALTMARTARWILRLDPEVARTFPEAGSRATGLDRHSTKRQEIGRLVAALAIGGAEPGDGSAVASFERVFASPNPSPVVRLRAADSLLGRAIEISGNQLAAPWLIRALRDWYFGDPRDVPVGLERASRVVQTAEEVVAVTYNRMIWGAESRLDRGTLRRLDRVLAEAGSAFQLSVMLATKLTWQFAVLDFDGAARTVSALTRHGVLDSVRRRLVPESIVQRLSALGALHGRNSRQCELACRQMVEALHGS
jgi:hypothetical protein